MIGARWPRPLCLLPMLALLAACTAGMVRDKAESLYQEGKYEKAIATYQEGAETYPESASLRAGEVRIRNEVISRLLLTAAELRLRGEFDEVQATINRAERIDPANGRVRAFQLDLARDRRAATALEEANALVEKKQPDRALQLLDLTLKEHPRHAGLNDLKRKLELEVRVSGEGASPRLADTRPVSFEFREVGIRMLLDALSRSTGVNFIVDKDVRQDLRVTVFLKNARLEDALELALTTNQLAIKVIDSRSALIYPATPEKLREYQDLVVRAFFLANADAKQVAGVLKNMLKLRDAQVDERLNAILIRETPETVRLAERIVALQDVSDPEVLLDVQVLEVQSSRLTDIGVTYPDSFSLTVLPLSGASSLTLNALKSIGSNRVSVSTPSVTVNLLGQVGDANLLANPKIRTKNHEKAKIMIGDKVPVFTSTSNSTGFVAESVQYLDVGLKVEVEPSIQLDDEVSIKVGLEVSNLAKEIKTPSGSSAYQIGTRNATTALRLRDGETQLLAGLISRQDRMSSSRIPGLGDLPMLGRLFGSQSDDRQRTEIVLAITPHVIRNIRRPDLNELEFWSGSESRLRLKPLGAGASLASPAQANAVPVGDTKTQNDQVVSPQMPAALAATPALAPVVPVLKLGFGNISVAKVGEVIAVPVIAKSDIAIRGGFVGVEYEKGMLELTDIQEGGFFQQGGVATSATKQIGQGGARTTFGVLQNGTLGAKGDGTFAVLKFKVVKPGKATIQLLDAKAVPASGNQDVASVPEPLVIEAK